MANRAEPDFGPFNYVRGFQRRLDNSGWWHSFELPDGRVIEGSCKLDGLKNRIAQFPIPHDLRGKRVLDIGAWDGWFSFEMERRGAEVLAIDVWDNPRFHQIHEILHSRVDYRQMNVYELDPRRVGRFDIVLFMGVLYHLKHPLLGLERVCSVTDGMAAVDSFVLREEHRPGAQVESRPVMEFYETCEFGGQTDNWVGPSLPCLLAFCRTAGFARAEVRSMLKFSACVACHRRWDEPRLTKGSAPKLIDVFHHTNFGINFNSSQDDYVTGWFDTAETGLTLDDIRPRVGAYGVRPIHLCEAEGHWQAKFKCPPGLDAGWHEVSLRIGRGPWSNAQPIALDVPTAVEAVTILSVCDGTTWTPDRVDLSRGKVVALWMGGLPENADRANLRVTVAGARAPVGYVESPKPGGRQVNVELPEGSWPEEPVPVVAEIGGVPSPPAPLKVVRG